MDIETDEVIVPDIDFEAIVTLSCDTFIYLCQKISGSDTIILTADKDALIISGTREKC